jgi:hypothetical protein
MHDVLEIAREPYMRRIADMSVTLRAYAARFMGLLRERWVLGVYFFLLLLTFETLRAYTIGEQVLIGLPPSRVSDSLINCLIAGPIIFFAVIFAHALLLRGVWRAIATVAFVVAAVGVSLAIVWEWRGGEALAGIAKDLILSNAAFNARNLWLYSAAGLLLAGYFAARDKEAATSKARKRAEIERAEAQRAVVDSRLKVIQARIEPALLFGVLENVRDRYQQDPHSAEALLDDLITYLRAALPQMRGAASTIAREVALAAAYLKIVPAGRDGNLAVTVCVAPELNDVPFPPMVLLPLVHSAAVANPSLIEISASCENASASIHVRIPAAVTPAGWAEERLEQTRQTLYALFGEAASASVVCDATGIVAVVAVPLPDIDVATSLGIAA